jgi:hypothetical protein
VAVGVRVAVEVGVRVGVRVAVEEGVRVGVGVKVEVGPAPAAVGEAVGVGAAGAKGLSFDHSGPLGDPPLMRYPLLGPPGYAAVS